MKIQAAVLRGAQSAYLIEQLDLADPAAHEVLVRIVGVGHCHTDLAPRAGVGFGEPPLVAGHEGSGVVEVVGSAVTNVDVGDHVVLSFDSCRECPACRDAQPAYCEAFLARNLIGRALDGSTSLIDGNGDAVAGRWFGQSSFASHAVVDARNVVVVDKQLPLELLGPLGCSIQTGAGAVLEALDVRPGDSIVITGTGAVGLSAVMAASAAGAATIIAVDLNAERLELARELGATHTIVGGTGNLTQQIREILPLGAQYGVDTTSVPTVMLELLDGLALRGVLGMLGLPQGDIPIPAITLGAGRTITGIVEGSSNPQAFIPRLIALWQAGRFPFDKLITQFPLSKINEAEQGSLAGLIIKPVLIPNS